MWRNHARKCWEERANRKRSILVFSIRALMNLSLPSTIITSDTPDWYFTRFYSLFVHVSSDRRKRLFTASQQFNVLTRITFTHALISLEIGHSSPRVADASLLRQHTRSVNCRDFSDGYTAYLFCSFQQQWSPVESDAMCIATIFLVRYSTVFAEQPPAYRSNCWCSETSMAVSSVRGCFMYWENRHPHEWFQRYQGEDLWASVYIEWFYWTFMHRDQSSTHPIHQQYPRKIPSFSNTNVVSLKFQWAGRRLCESNENSDKPDDV